MPMAIPIPVARQRDGFLLSNDAYAKEVARFRAELGGVEADVSHLGKVKTGRGCVWIRKLSDVDRPALEKAIQFVWAGN